VAECDQRRLQPDASSLLDTPAISELEVRQALKHLPSGHSPGLDGLPVEVYRRGTDLLAPLLSRLFTAAEELAQLPPCFLDGVVVSLPKQGDLTDPANYRPITLLNADYKLLAKVLANRLLPHLAAVIDPVQTGYVPGRRIGSNVLTLQLLGPYLAAQKQSAAAVFLDVRKAFDTVDRDFLMAVMAALGVGPRFCAWVRLLLSGTRARAVLNGHLSQFAAFLAGVRQGCPLSALLYLFVGEALLRFLRRHDAYGVPVPGPSRLVALQYADDMQIFLSSLQLESSLLADLAVFGAASNQHANVHKTEVLLLGAAAAPAVTRTPGGLKLVPETSALGFTFSHGSGAAHPIGGWTVKLERSLHQAQQLVHQPLSVFGRASAVSAYVSSQLLYAAEFAGLPPAAALSRFQRGVAAIVDRRQRPDSSTRRFAGVRWDLLQGPPAAGGFGLLHLVEHVRARHLIWFICIRDAGIVHPWVVLARALLALHLPGLTPTAWYNDVVLSPALPAVLVRMLSAVSGAPVPEPIQTPSDVQLGWHVPGLRKPLLLSALTVRAATALLLPQGDGSVVAVRRARILALVSQVLPDLTLAEQGTVSARVASSLSLLWRLRWAPTHKQVYWRLLVDALPTAERLHQGSVVCPCRVHPESERRPGRLHYFVGCWVAACVYQTLTSACGHSVTPRHVLFLQPPPGVYAPVWRVVCLAAVNAMWHERVLRDGGAADGHWRRTAARGRAAIDSFWGYLSDFCAHGRPPGGWRRRVLPSHPFMCYPAESASLRVRRPAACYTVA
jgi:hypothetical protein